MSVSVDGGTPDVLVPPPSADSGNGTIMALAVDCTDVYYASDIGLVGKVPRTGGTPTILVPADPTGNRFIGGLAADAARVYFTYLVGPSGSTVQSVPVAGGPVTTLATGQSAAAGIAVDANYVYWTNRGSFTVMKLAK